MEEYSKQDVLVADSQRNVNFQEVAVFHADARCRVLFFDMVLSNQILSQSAGQLLPSARKASRPTLRSSIIDHDLAAIWPSSRISRMSSVDAMSNMDNNNIAAGGASSIPFALGNSDSTNNIVPDRYSAKALEISIYGSQVQPLIPFNLPFRLIMKNGIVKEELYSIVCLEISIYAGE